MNGVRFPQSCKFILVKWGQRHIVLLMRNIVLPSHGEYKILGQPLSFMTERLNTDTSCNRNINKCRQYFSFVLCHLQDLPVVSDIFLHAMHENFPLFDSTLLRIFVLSLPISYLVHEIQYMKPIRGLLVWPGQQLEVPDHHNFWGSMYLKWYSHRRRKIWETTGSYCRNAACLIYAYTCRRIVP